MIFDSISHILPGCLPASFRGIPFFVPDTQTEVGRRVAEHLFPGIDRAAYDDHGLSPAIVTIDGLMVGDDYVFQARALQAAFERPGPGTLMHPWLGGMTVILEEPAEISFSATELRVARFYVTFKRVQSSWGMSFGSTAALLISAAFDLLSAVRRLARSPGTVTMSAVRSSATQRSYRVFQSEWTGLTAERTGPRIVAQMPTAAPSGPDGFGAAFEALTQSILDQVPALIGEAAVAPSAEAETLLTVLSGRDAVDICLSAVERFTVAQADAPSPSDRALLLSVAGDALAKACQASAYVEHASRSEAYALRAAVSGAIDKLSDALSELDETGFAAPASAVRRAALDLRAAAIADINEAIGRLPAIVTLDLDRDTDAFQIANHLYGDQLDRIEAGYADIVARNRPRHPAYLPAGKIEALK